jgi:NADH dehydrogenase FAD-containing subunit
MDFGRLDLGKINVEFKDMTIGNMNQRTFANVILVDRTNPGAPNKCYILKNDEIFSEAAIENFKEGFYSFDEKDFFMIGEVDSINKIQKYILLTNKNSISYNHLIIAFGTHYSMLSYEFVAGVQTLVDAIRVRKKIPSAFAVVNKPPQATSNRKMKNSKYKDNLNFSKKIEILKTRKMNKLANSASSYTLNHSKKMVYEVQV